MELTIRKWKIEDAGELAEALNNKKIQNNLRDGLPYPYTINDAKEYINAVLTADQDTTYAFAIVVDGQVAGSIGVTRCNNIHSLTAELGYYIAESHWGREIGTEAVQKTCRYIFEQTDIIRIFAEPFAYNGPSCRVLEKAGFLCEGILRKNAVKNGIVQDMKMYALIKEV